jgi:hypothetical protein
MITIPSSWNATGNCWMTRLVVVSETAVAITMISPDRRKLSFKDALKLSKVTIPPMRSPLIQSGRFICGNRKMISFPTGTPKTICRSTRVVKIKNAILVMTKNDFQLFESTMRVLAIQMETAIINITTSKFAWSEIEMAAQTDHNHQVEA